MSQAGRNIAHAALAALAALAVCALSVLGLLFTLVCAPPLPWDAGPDAN